MGNDSGTEKSDEEEVPWIYSNDDEENKHDNDETQRDESVHEDEYVHTDDDERTETNNEDQAMGDTEKNDEDKEEEEKDTGTVKESTDANVASMVDVQIQQEIPYVLSAPLHDVLASIIPPTPTNPTPSLIPTTSTITTSEAPTSTFVNPESKTLSALQLRVSDLEKEVKELKQADLSTTLRASIRYEVPSAVNEYLGSSLGDALQKELQKHTEELRQEYS
ncbi:hypothetical protein Tco_1536378 [Tanacetum coccineum]